MKKYKDNMQTKEQGEKQAESGVPKLRVRLFWVPNFLRISFGAVVRVLIKVELEQFYR